MSLLVESSKSVLVSIRWRAFTILVVFPQTPSWAQIVEHVSWGKELTNATHPTGEEENEEVGEMMSMFESNDTDDNIQNSSILASSPKMNHHPVGMDDGYAAICTDIKRLDLREFLIYHYYHLGIKYFYSMDDGSEPPLSEMEDFGIPRSALAFTYQDRATREFRMQMVFYENCLQERGKLHHWIAFFDADEFLEVTSPTQTFREILEEFEKQDHVGAIRVNWRMHTSAGLLTQPESARKAFTTCIYDDVEHQGAASDNRHIKSIVRPSKTAAHFNPHKFRMIPGALTVGEDGDVIASIAWRPITRARLSLHHYAVKSRAEYEERYRGGMG